MRGGPGPRRRGRPRVHGQIRQRGPEARGCRPPRSIARWPSSPRNCARPSPRPRAGPGSCTRPSCPPSLDRGRDRVDRHRAVHPGPPGGRYVPGGLVAYPSSVLMNVIPAQVAGVAEIAVASPPQPEFDGAPHPAVLAACALLGVTEVHAAGGAQAIAMLGYGTAECAARRRDHRAGQRVRRGGQAAAAGPGRDRRRGRADRDRDHRRRRRRRELHRRRPDRAGRARPAGGLPADQHQRGAGRRGSSGAGQGGAAGAAQRAGQGGADRSVGVCPGRRRRLGAGRVRRLGARAPGDPGGRCRDPGPPGAQRRRHLRRRLGAGVARRLPGGLEPRAAHRRHRPLLRRPVGAVVPALRAPGRVRRAGARRGGAAHRRARRRRGPGRARAGGPGPDTSPRPGSQRRRADRNGRAARRATLRRTRRDGRSRTAAAAHPAGPAPAAVRTARRS